MKKMALRCCVILFMISSVFLVPSSSFAGTVPSVINYQGRLTDNHGDSLAEGFYHIQFRVWDHPTATGAGDLIWGREFPLHIMTGGVFNILLSDDGGTLTPAPLITNLRDAFAGQDRYLGLTISRTPGGDVPSPAEISPRQRLVSAPFAFCAEQAHTAPDDFTVTGHLYVSPFGAWLTGGLSVSNGNLALRGNWISRDGGNQGLNVDAAGNVGVGTNAPTAALHVAGRVKDKTGYLMPAGAVVPYAGASAPEGWLECNGAAVSRTTYADLYAAIGVAYGTGDGSTTFNLPDMRGRAPIGDGQGTGLSSRARGDKPGEETHTLTIAEMPSHAHSYTRNDSQGTWLAGGSSVLKDTKGDTTGYTGGGGSHNNMQPSLVLKYIIKY